MSKKTERAAIVGDLIIKTDGMVEVEQHPSLNARVTLMDDGYALVQVAYGPVWGGWPSDVTRKIEATGAQIIDTRLERVVVETR